MLRHYIPMLTFRVTIVLRWWEQELAGTAPLSFPSNFSSHKDTIAGSNECPVRNPTKKEKLLVSRTGRRNLCLAWLLYILGHPSMCVYTKQPFLRNRSRPGSDSTWHHNGAYDGLRKLRHVTYIRDHCLGQMEGRIAGNEQAKHCRTGEARSSNRAASSARVSKPQQHTIIITIIELPLGDSVHSVSYNSHQSLCARCHYLSACRYIRSLSRATRDRGSRL